MTALAYEPFGLRALTEGAASATRRGRSAVDPLLAGGAPSVSAWIERVPSDKKLSAHLSRYRELAREGWDVTALLAPDSKTVVLMACRTQQLSLIGDA